MGKDFEITETVTGLKYDKVLLLPHGHPDKVRFITVADMFGEIFKRPGEIK
jgi:hypothetical protein